MKMKWQEAKAEAQLLAQKLDVIVAHDRTRIYISGSNIVPVISAKKEGTWTAVLVSLRAMERWKWYVVGIMGSVDPDYWLDRFEAVFAPSPERAINVWIKNREGWLRDDERQHIKIWDVLDKKPLGWSAMQEYHPRNTPKALYRYIPGIPGKAKAL